MRRKFCWARDSATDRCDFAQLLVSVGRSLGENGHDCPAREPNYLAAYDRN
jgi:hypothetical protein